MEAFDAGDSRDFGSVDFVEPKLVGFWTTPSITNLLEAMAKAQEELHQPEKTSEAEIVSAKARFKYKYADLGECMMAWFAVGPKNGLSIMQPPLPPTMPTWRARDNGDGGEIIPGIVRVLTQLGHRSGEWIRTLYEMPVTAMQPQAFGIATTYCRRYSINGITGMAPVDGDDQDGAMPAAQQQPQKGSHLPASVDPKKQLAEAIAKWEAHVLKNNDPAILTSLWTQLRSNPKELAEAVVPKLLEHATKLGHVIKQAEMLIEFAPQPQPAPVVQTAPPAPVPQPAPAKPTQPIGQDPTAFVNGKDKWAEQIAAINTPEALTAMIAKVNALTQPLQNTVKRIMFDAASQHGWMYDQRTGSFQSQINF